MKKYLELFKDGFDSTVAEKTEVKNWPYVGYSPSEGVVFTVIPEQNQSGYQMIDLGLSVKWADRNIGAENPYDAGLYFSWGNVDGHAVDESGNVTDGYSFDEKTYKGTSGAGFTGDVLDSTHDAATSIMGSGWYMPTPLETRELVQNTDHYYIDLNGNIVAGPFNYETNESDKGLDYSDLRSICFVKKDTTFDYNDRSNFIEFPFAGNCWGSLRGGDGLFGSVWSSVIGRSVSKAREFSFESAGAIHGSEEYFRDCGLCIRGVHP